MHERARDDARQKRHERPQYECSRRLSANRRCQALIPVRSLFTPESENVDQGFVDVDLRRRKGSDSIMPRVEFPRHDWGPNSAVLAVAATNSAVGGGKAVEEEERSPTRSRNQ